MQQEAAALTIHVDRIAQRFALVALNSTDPSLFNVSRDSIYVRRGTSSQGTRLWVAHDTTRSAESYARFRLLGKSLAYQIDLSHVGCSCNAALYWVSMPGYDELGKPNPGEMGNYYCDANQVGGVWCWEMDSIEANMHTMQVAPHICSAPPGHHISSCDKAGARRNSWFVNRKGLCPYDDCIIDSRAPFRHVQNFHSNASRLLRIENRLEQHGRSFVFDATSDEKYLAKMSNALSKGMTLTFQLWGDSWLLMSWLDYMTFCIGACPNDARVTFSNISITEL